MEIPRQFYGLFEITSTSADHIRLGMTGTYQLIPNLSCISTCFLQLKIVSSQLE